MALALEIKANVQHVDASVKALGQALAKGLVSDLNSWILDVFRDTKTVEPRVPVDTGALQSTGQVIPAKVEKTDIVTGIRYGGIAGPPFNKVVDYAVITHEDTSRSYHRPGAGPKYVSTHIQRGLPELSKRVKDKANKAWATVSFEATGRSVF